MGYSDGIFHLRSIVGFYIGVTFMDDSGTGIKRLGKTSEDTGPEETSRTSPETIHYPRDGGSRGKEGVRVGFYLDNFENYKIHYYRGIGKHIFSLTVLVCKPKRI